MNKVPQLLAHRYLKGVRANSNISTMILVSFISIMLSTSAITLVTAIMNGFEKVTHSKLQGIQAQLMLRANGQPLDAHKIGEVLDTEFPEVAGWSPSSSAHAIIQKTDSDGLDHVVLLRAVDPNKEPQVTKLFERIMIPQDFSASQLIEHNKVVIGQALADQLNILPGDKATLLYVNKTTTKKNRMNLLQQEIIAAGIFDTGIDEFDSSLILVPFTLMKKMFGSSDPDQINIKLKNDAIEPEQIQKLKDRFHLEVYSWKDLYPALVSALRLEKYAMILLLALMVILATSNIISVMYMLITYKRIDIAILKSMGASDGLIMKIFMYMGMMISCAATCSGIALGWAVGYLLDKYPLITLPDTYYVDKLPIIIEWPLLLLIGAFVITISFIAILLPTQSIKKMKITQVLKFER